MKGRAIGTEKRSVIAKGLGEEYERADEHKNTLLFHSTVVTLID